MKTITFETEEDWMEARKGKITGSTLKDLISLKGATKKGFYKLIAERVAVPGDGEIAMERGLRLEEEAGKRFSMDTGKKVEKKLVLWVSDDNENMAVSPDFVIGKNEALETKCLDSANHLEVWLTQKVPGEYEFQKLQYFIVNPKLKTLYFGFYDPRVPSKDFFYLTFKREDLAADIELYRDEQLKILKEVERITLELSQF